MKALFLSFLFSLAAGGAFAQTATPAPALTRQNPPVQTVEAACGQCKFGLKGHGCDLAVRIDGKAYFVDGTDIDAHGDAHAKDGFCNAIRQARVQGTVQNNRFKATSFQLVTEPAKK
ncbi:DUF6370 family protein [Rufibacter quisquiliarum]|uniref:Glutaminyl-tRNA synthetase n=1 Tax=Rufibacter quisquiliarum TaxID=1549639 RepID=A0A839GE85_9BACT|nr:DUF6370 family protein [Rufibacter quisquiliarum]MBA9076750.1 hypothetical protein [Rufibacter quisquiliarum]